MTEGDDRRTGDRRASADDALEPIKQEVAANTIAILGVLSELRSQRIMTTSSVENLRVEQERARRVRAIVAGGIGVGAVFSYDEHVEHCSPGSRVTRGFNKILGEPPKKGLTQEQAQSQQQKAFLSEYDHASVWCDVSIPLHTHDGSPWPTHGDIAGITLLGFVAVFAVTYHIFKTRFDREKARQVVADDAAKAAEADRIAHWKLANGKR